MKEPDGESIGAEGRREIEGREIGSVLGRKGERGDTKGQGMEGGSVWGRRRLNPHCPYNCPHNCCTMQK